MKINTSLGHGRIKPANIQIIIDLQDRTENLTKEEPDLPEQINTRKKIKRHNAKTKKSLDTDWRTYKRWRQKLCKREDK